MNTQIYLGYFCSLLCGFFWAYGLILFKSLATPLNPSAINFFKNTLGLILFFLFGLYLEEASLFSYESSEMNLLLISGFLGIGFADSLALYTLNKLGGSTFAILETTYSLFVLILSALLLGEWLNFFQAIGAFLIIFAVFIASLNMKEKAKRVANSKRPMAFVLGLISFIAMAYGIVIIKPVFDNVALVHVITIRLCAGAASSFFFWLLFEPKLKSCGSLYKSSEKTKFLTASFFTGFIAMFFWLAGMKYAPVGIAAVLNQTSTFFIVILSALILKEKITARKIFAVMVAFIGVCVIVI